MYQCDKLRKNKALKECLDCPMQKFTDENKLCSDYLKLFNKIEELENIIKTLRA